MPTRKQLHTLWESDFEFFYRDQDFNLIPRPSETKYRKNFDHHGHQTVENLCHEFNTQPPIVDDIICPYTIGIEIECKFRYYFPEIFEEYFAAGQYYELSEDQKEHVNRVIAQHETRVLAHLEATVECGVPRGGDKYWEFALNPVNNLKYLIQQILILKEQNLIPSGGRHSLHITLGGLKPSRELYWVLAYLQLMFVDSDRIREALSEVNSNKSSSWGKKGLAGICEKFESDLDGCTKGLEFRTLYIDDETDIVQLFTVLNNLLTLMYNNQPLDFIPLLVNEFKNLGLPDVNWGRPHQSQEIWQVYCDNFNKLSTFTKSIKIL